MRVSVRIAILALLALLTTSAFAGDAPKAEPTTAELQAQLQEQQQRLARLEQLVMEQTRILEEMRKQMAAHPNGGSEPAAEPAAAALEMERLSGELDAVAETSRETTERLAKMEKDTPAAIQKTEDRVKSIGPFNYTGDVRLRYEPFFGGTMASSRHRPRFRLRFNALAKFSDEISGGFSLGSGDLTDPISTNQTLEGFYQRKPIAIDRAFFQYQPLWFKSFKIVGGKFAYTWQRTQLTWDDDLNPEGVSQVLEFNFKESPLEKLTFVGFQTPIRESSGGRDSAMYGAQIGTGWKFTDRLRFSASTAYYGFQNVDSIRVAQAASGLTGSSNTNAANATQFASKFGIVDVIGRFDVNTWSARFPLMLQFNFAQNTRACGNNTVIVCNPRDRQAYWAEAQVGQNREQGDVQVGYTFIRLERESVLAAFNFSDLRSPTNSVTHRMNFGYQAYRNVGLSYTILVGRSLVSATPEDWLKRMQFDLVYKF